MSLAKLKNCSQILNIGGWNATSGIEVEQEHQTDDDHHCIQLTWALAHTLYLIVMVKGFVKNKLHVI